MKENLSRIVCVNSGEAYDYASQEVVKASGRKHPLYIFLDKDGGYMCEVRYGGKTANALQRGLWTHTKRAVKYFDSLTNGWVSYKQNHSLVTLIRLALNTTKATHKGVNEVLQKEIDLLKRTW